MKNLITISSAALFSAVALAAPFAAHAQYGGGGGAIIGGFAAPNPLPGANLGLSTPNPSNSNIDNGQVLGASAFNFTQDLWFHMPRNSDVAQLQTTLVADGYSIPDSVTNYFGSETLAAVKAFQAANGIRATGYVGPLTRAALNKGVLPTTPE